MSDPESTTYSWLKAAAVPPLREGELQVWRLDLDKPESRGLLKRAFEALSPDERERAARMRTGTAPEEFIAGRGSLRFLLSHTLNCHPKAISIVAGNHRKPALRPLHGRRVPHFNVSHSRGMVLIALSFVGPVGVDVEYMDASIESLDVARAAFHPDDLLRIESAACAKERAAAFYACWTRREAIAKADGRGLTLPASGFSAGTLNYSEQRVELDDGDAPGYFRAGVSRYFVRNLYVSAGHMGAVAVAQPCATAVLLDLSCIAGSSLGQCFVAPPGEAGVVSQVKESAITFFRKESNLSGD